AADDQPAQPGSGLRPRLRAQRSAQDADPRGALEFFRLRRHQRHPRPETRLSGLVLRLHPSPFLALVIVLMHAAAAASVLLVLPGAAGAALALALFLLGAAAAWSRALLRSPLAVRAIGIAGEALSLELQSGEKVSAEASERRFVSRFVVTLP